MLERVFHHYQDLEEYSFGMWRIVRGEERKANAMRAAELMRSPKDFEAAMMKCTATWHKSCEHNLTSENSNRLAWLGHAGCLIGAGSPEENTRAGWHMLTRAEQDVANVVAQSVLDGWVSSSKKETQGDFFGA